MMSEYIYIYVYILCMYVHDAEALTIAGAIAKSIDLAYKST